MSLGALKAGETGFPPASFRKALRAVAWMSQLRRPE
jgi:hypothetical protein